MLSQDMNSEPSSTRLCEAAKDGHSTVTEKMRLYKKTMRYNPSWQKKWNWVVYDKNEEGMLSRVHETW